MGTKIEPEQSVSVSTAKLIGGCAIAVVTLLVGLATLHGQFIVPAVAEKVRVIIATELKDHASRPHEGAVNVKMLDDRLEGLATKADVARIEGQLQMLAAQVAALSENR